jgi:hypothetical protein
LEEGKKGFNSAAAVSCYCLLRGRVDFFAAGGGEDGKNSGGCRAEILCSRRWRGREKQRWLQSREQSGARGRRERGFPKDLFVILENCRDLLVKTNLTTVLGLKHKCDQNKSCTTFQTLQLCFRV